MAIEAFTHVGGTETYVLTVAEQLQRLGHQVRIHAQRLGDMAMLAHDRGVDVVGDPDALGSAPDVVLAQDAAMAYDLADRYPGVPQVFVNHSAMFDPQLPPLVPGVVDAVVVMSERFQARLKALDADLRIVRLRQPIDTERLVPRRAPAGTPRRALLLGNYLVGEARRLLVDTWSEMGLEVVQVGMVTRPTLQPEDEIAAADIVVGKSRAVLEAMCAGRPAYVYDAFGGDGWVTAATYAAIEADALAGQAFPAVIDADRLRADLAAYDPAMGQVNRSLILKHHQARTHAQELVRLFIEVAPRTSTGRPLTEAGELARQLRMRWRAEGELVGIRGAFQVESERWAAESAVSAEELAVERAANLAADLQVDHLTNLLRTSELSLQHAQDQLASERAIRTSAERRRDRARARGRRLQARHANLLSRRWVRLGQALRLLPRPRKEIR